jgi:hypothetical protein
VNEAGGTPGLGDVHADADGMTVVGSVEHVPLPWPSKLADPPHQHADLDAKIRHVEDRLTTANRPWFRQATAVVAVLALLFSFGTTVVSLNRAAQQDENDRKSELLALIDQLASLSRDMTSDAATYANNPAALNAVSVEINQQQLLAAEQAASVMAQIPNDVGSAEYGFVANVLVANGNDELGLPLLEDAVDRASNANDLVGALRSLAVHDFAVGQVADGRAAYGQAMQVFTRFPNPSAFYVAFTSLWTAINWTQSELSIGACAAAAQRLDAGRAFLSTVGLQSPAGREYSQLSTQVAACVPGAALPSSPPASLPALGSPPPS